MDFKKLSKIQDSAVKDDDKAVERFNALRYRVGDNPKHYTNQIDKCQGDKKLERAATFYKLAVENGLTETAKTIKAKYPDIYSSEEEIAADKAAAEEEARIKKEEEDKRKAEEEAKKPLNILIANMEKTGKSPCYGMSDDQVKDLQDKLYNELVPRSGEAATQAGELLRAYNDLMYRWYNDGDWVEKGGGFEGDETFSPRSVSNMKYLTSHGAAQISFFFESCRDVKDFQRKTERMLLNQIVKKELYKVPNSTDSRNYWKPGKRK